MDQQKPITHITAGLIIAGVLVVISTILNFMDLSMKPGVAFLQPVVIILALVLFIRSWGNANGNRLSFGNLFAYGFKTTAVFTIITIIFTIIFLLLFPDMKEKSLEMARQKLEDDPRVSEEQMEQALEISRKFFWVAVVGGSMLSMVIMGAIGSLIGAAVTKKNPNSPFDQQPQ
jgi:hypothetical protein